MINKIPFLCPVTKTNLRFCDRASLIETVEEPTTVTEGMSGFYISDAAGLAFPIEDEVHIFLATAALKLRSSGAAAVGSVGAPGNDSVRHWYDRFGWQKTARGVYQDTDHFSFAEMTTAKRYEIASHLSMIERLGSGDAILNAASGALPHAYHFAYGFYFGTPICLDFSMTALREAKQKLGPGGVYVLADICHMPFADESFDSIVSAYTIQHIDKSDQERAVTELYRVVKRGRSLIVINQSAYYAQKWLRRAIIFGLKAWGKLARTARTAADPNKDSQSKSTPPHPLYYHAEPDHWWAAMGRKLKAKTRVECFRLLEHGEILRIFSHRPNYVGKIRAVEMLLPRMLAGQSAYLLIEFRKE
jgi:ubiquinone/menaquinone biosynthesis C-methylase UbiE/uncharacterized protein YbaR (Trm112 family)